MESPHDRPRSWRRSSAILLLALSAACAAAPREVEVLRFRADTAEQFWAQVWRRAWAAPTDPPDLVEWSAPAGTTPDDNDTIRGLPDAWDPCCLVQRDEGERRILGFAMQLVTVGQVLQEEPVRPWIESLGIPYDFPLSQGIFLVVPKRQCARVLDLLTEDPVGRWVRRYEDLRVDFPSVSPRHQQLVWGHRGAWRIRDVFDDRVVAQGKTRSCAERAEVPAPAQGWLPGHRYEVEPVDEDRGVIADSCSFAVVESFPGTGPGASLVLSGREAPFCDPGHRRSAWDSFPWAHWCPGADESARAEVGVLVAVARPGATLPIVEPRPGVHIVAPDRLAGLNLCLPGAEPSDMCVDGPWTLFPVGTRILWQAIAVLPREVVASDLMVYTVPVSDAKGAPDVDSWLQQGDLLPTAARRQWLAKAIERLAGSAH